MNNLPGAFLKVVVALEAIHRAHMFATQLYRSYTDGSQLGGPIKP